ncbi:MAG: CoA transferase [Betaproteobacteria bacterium]|nr:CoA transferase [Betaproteobacteria bacterium]
MTHPLTGVRILELGQIIAGTYGSQVLTDLGAEVIKIETPEGDLGRIPSVAPYKGVSALFLTFNRNKKSIVINLKSDEGRELFYQLVKHSDVVIDNFRAGVLERLKVDYATLSQINPRIIQCSVTGFGSDGAYKGFPALDLVIQAIGGHLSITGEPGRPPARVGIPLADLSGGIFSCEAILAALYQREKTGNGCRVETSMFDGMLNLLSYMATHYLSTGEVPKPQGTAHEFTVPWQAFAAQDGYLVIATRQENFWKKLCVVLEHPELADDARFATNPQRLEHRAVLVPILENLLKQKTVKAWLDKLYAAEVPAAPVNDLAGAFTEPPVAEREMIVEYEHPQVGRVRLPGNPIKFDGMGKTLSRPAPLLGEHTDAVLRELLKLPPAAIAQLHEQGIIK